MPIEPVYFETPAEWRNWLKKHHASAAELHVGYHRVHTRASGVRSVTWHETVAEALCFGWIDGIRRTVDADRYTVRFTPRRAGSDWSAVNVRLMGELEAAGRMTEHGRAAYERRRHKSGPKAAGYKAAKKDGKLDAARTKAFRKNKAAWAFFSEQPPGYRRSAAWWVMQAKQEETRDRRLAQLAAISASGKRLAW